VKLKKIMENVNFDIIMGNTDIEIEKIQYDSRKVKPGDAFFCIEG
jgi:UDP-N-acetylmuramoyl-L-alanyl-D-glutamate--2,6-diaminopimelate ligase